MEAQIFEMGNVPKPKEPEEMTAKERSRRFKIKARKDGNTYKSPSWLSSSQWIDPVNWLGAIWDSDTAKAVRAWFVNDAGYDKESRRVVRGRLNRLLRKFGLEPVGATAHTFSLTGPYGGVYLAEDPESAITPEEAEEQARQRRLAQTATDEPEMLIVGVRHYD